MSSSRDFYEILGVDRAADSEQIKKAYRKIAMQYHPDKNPGDKVAEEKFKEAAEAYGVLSDGDKRSRYDRFGHAAFQNGGGGFGGGGFASAEDIFSNFGDIFSDLFGGGMGGGRQSSRSRTGPRRGSDLRYVVEVTLKEVIEGAEKQIEFDVEHSCESCSGSGAEKGSQASTCGTCGGRGQVVAQQGFFTMATTCPTCRGEGQVIKNPCKKCKGSGRTEQHRKIDISIPAGVDTGTRLRVSGEGEGGYRGGSSGDLYVEVVVKDDPRFQRQGDHLLGELSVHYLQILLGAEIEVNTVTGKTKIKVPRGSQVGDTIKVQGEGVPSLRGSRRGDIYLTLGVEFPHKLSGPEEALLAQIAQEKGILVQSETDSGLSGIFKKKK